MAARNPFEQLLNNDTAETDQARPVPRDLMADAYLSELMSRLADAQRRGYTPGIPLGRMGPMGDIMGREREHNGLPHDHGLRGTADSYDAVSQYPAAISPFGLGNRGQRAFEHGSAASYGAPVTTGNEETDEMLSGDDPFDPTFGIDMTQFDAEQFESGQFELDAAPGAGVDGIEPEQSPFSLPGADTLSLPPTPQVRPDPGLDKLRQAIRPGFAQMSTYGYSQPNSDPYAEDLTALLRRLVRSA